MEKFAIWFLLISFAIVLIYNIRYFIKFGFEKLKHYIIKIKHFCISFKQSSTFDLSTIKITKLKPINPLKTLLMILSQTKGIKAFLLSINVFIISFFTLFPKAFNISPRYLKITIGIFLLINLIYFLSKYVIYTENRISIVLSIFFYLIYTLEFFIKYAGDKKPNESFLLISLLVTTIFSIVLLLAILKTFPKYGIISFIIICVFFIFISSLYFGVYYINTEILNIKVQNTNIQKIIIVGLYYYFTYPTIEIINSATLIPYIQYLLGKLFAILIIGKLLDKVILINKDKMYNIR